MTNLIVNYLPQSMSQDEIKAIFGSIGEMESCKLIKDRGTGESLGYGFVKYRNASNAQKALEIFNGLRLQNKKIKVSIARPSSSLIKGANLYVGGIPKSMSEHDLQKLFSPCGNIITLRILTDPKTETSRGVGFVRFDTRLEAEAAIKQLNGLLLAGCSEPLIVKFANHPTIEPVEGSYLQQPFSQEEKPSECCLVVDNLAAEMDELDVWQLFGPYGAVKGVQMVTCAINNDASCMDASNNQHLVVQNQQQLRAPFSEQHEKPLRVKRAAYVKMNDYQNALGAIACLNGVFVRGRMLHVAFRRSASATNGLNNFSSVTNTFKNSAVCHNDCFYSSNSGKNALNSSFSNYITPDNCYQQLYNPSYDAGYASHDVSSSFYADGDTREAVGHYKNLNNTL